MNRHEFITILTNELRKFDPSELEDILQYYNEYFDESGEDNEQAVIAELGSPEKLAADIKEDLFLKCLEGENENFNSFHEGYTTESNSSGECMRTQLDSFKNIDVSIHAGRIELIKSNQNAIEYNIHTQEKVSVCEIANDTFTFKTSFRFSIKMFSFKETYVKIYYKDDTILENISLKTNSGRVETNNITAKNLAIKSTSGSLKMSDIKASNINVTGVSGSVKLDNISSDTVNVHNTSGSISIDGVTCQDIFVKNMSGSIKLYGAKTSSAKINGTSGSIYVQGQLMGRSIIHNTSGSVKVHTSLPKSEYGYKLSSTSGSTKVDNNTFKGCILEEKLNFIDASTMSGSVKVHFNSKG